MSNIFDERDREDLAKGRKARPIKGYTPPAPPAPRKEEGVVEESSQTQPQPQGVQEQNLPIPKQNIYQPVPLAPPMNYGTMKGDVLANQDSVIDAEVQAKQTGNSDILTQALQFQQYQNPQQDETFDERTVEKYDSEALERQRSSWDKYIIPSTVGNSPSVQFDEAGNVVRTVPESEVQRGIRGLNSQLGKSLEDALDEDNWFNRNLQRSVEFFRYGGNALDRLNLQLIEKLPWSPMSIGQNVGKFLLGESEESKERIQQIKDEFVGKTLPDLTNKPRSKGYELQDPLLPQIGDYGKAGILSLGTMLLNLPENLVSAGVYEYADAWRRQKKRNDNIDNGLLKGTLNALLPLTSIGGGTYEGTKNFLWNVYDEALHGTDDSDDGRFVQVLKGKDISLAGRNSEEKYLGVQEPDNLKVGDRTGNWWWDLPENLVDLQVALTGREYTDKERANQLKWAHWGTQGVVATFLEFGLDAPIDASLDALRKTPKLLADHLTDTGRVISKNIPYQPIDNFGDLPKAPKVLVRQPNTTSIKPYEYTVKPDRVEVVSPDLVDTTSITGVPELPSYTKKPRQIDDTITMDEPSGLPQTGSEVIDDVVESTPLEESTQFIGKLGEADKPPRQSNVEITDYTITMDDIVPNTSKSQSALVQLGSDTPTLRRTKDLMYEPRTPEQLSEVGRLLLDSEGKPVVNGVLNPYEATVLGDMYPRDFGKLGKPIPENLSQADTLALPDGTKLDISRNPVPEVEQKPYNQLIKELDEIRSEMITHDPKDVEWFKKTRELHNKKTAEARRALARLNHEDYAREVIPDSYKTSNITDIVPYTKASRDVEMYGTRMGQLEREMDELQSVIEGIEIRRKALPEAYRDIDVEENTRKLYTGIDKTETPIYKQPEEFTAYDANLDAEDATKSVPYQTAKVVDEFWLHGTQAKDMDIRGYLPREGSGTHELGLGVYFTKREDVAESAAKQFGYDNTPTRLERQVKAPTIKRVSTKRLSNVLDLNMQPSKKEFTELVRPAFFVYNKETTEMTQEAFNNFWHFFKEYDDGSLHTVHSAFRDWWDEYPNWGSMDEIRFRQFEEELFDTLSEHFDAGLYKGVNGEETLIVYKPEKLINVDTNVLRREEGIDSVMEALEARRFIEDYTAKQNPYDEYRISRSTEANQNLLEYQQELVAEEYAKESIEQGGAIVKLSDERSSVLAKKDSQELAVVSEAAEETRLQKLVERVKKQTKSEVPKGKAPTDEVSELMKENARFRKARGKVEKELRSVEKQIPKYNKGTKQRSRLEARRQRLINEGTEIDKRVSELRRNLKSTVPNEPKSSPLWDKFEHLRDILHSHEKQILDPHWFTKSGSYARMSFYEKMKLRVEKLITEFVESSWAGDYGKIQKELVELARLGRGTFAKAVSRMEADKVIGTVQRKVDKLLAPYKLTKAQKATIFSSLAELQMSPYLVESSVKANKNMVKYLNTLLDSHYKRFLDWGVPEHVLSEVAMEVKKVPQVYEEVYHIIEQTGLSFGKEKLLGYLPRIGTSQFTRAMDDGLNLSSFTKARASFEYVAEDSKLMDLLINRLHPRFFKEKLPNILKRQGIDPDTVKNFDDLVALNDDNLLHYTVIENLDADTVDMLLEMGVLTKIPFTTEKSAKWIIENYELPFKELNDVFIQDPQKAFSMYKHGLEESVAKTSMIAGLLDNHTWAVNKAFIEDLDDATKKVYEDWIPAKDVIPESILSKVDPEIVKQLDELNVHPVVHDALRAQLGVETSPLLTGIVGQAVNTMFKYMSGTLLGTMSMFTNNVLGNVVGLVSRNVSPFRFTNFLQMYTKAKVDAIRKGLDVANLKPFMSNEKIYANGTMSQRDLYDLALERGLITEFNAFGEGVPTNRLSEMPDSIIRSAKEFVHFAKTGKNKWASELISRMLEGTESALDNTLFKWVSFANVLTDNAYRFSLLEAVLSDTPLVSKHITFDRKFFTGVPHFGDNEISEAIKWVNHNSYLFDDIGKNEGFMRFLIPFWTFQRKNMVNTARFINDHPSRFGSYLKLVNRTQNEFEQKHNEEWNNIQNIGWMKNNGIVPFIIPADISASGTDEVYTFPTAQFVPQGAAIKTPLDALEAMGLDFETEPPHKNKANPLSTTRNKGLKSFIVASGSPWLKGMLALLDSDFLYEYDREYTPNTDIRRDYPFGLNKTGYQILKLYGRPLYNLWKYLPEQLTGRAPTLDPKTGKYDEGKPSAFTGQLPHWTKSTSKQPLGREGVAGTITSLSEMFGLAPYHIDTLFAQERTIKEIEGQLYEGKAEIRRLVKQLENVNVDDTGTRERAAKEINTYTLAIIHLNAELEMYRTWRKLNNIPHHRAVDKIRKENIQVSRELPKKVREEIYRRNYDKYKNLFQ